MDKFWRGSDETSLRGPGGPGKVSVKGDSRCWCPESTWHWETWWGHFCDRIRGHLRGEGENNPVATWEWPSHSGSKGFCLQLPLGEGNRLKLLGLSDPHKYIVLLPNHPDRGCRHCPLSPTLQGLVYSQQLSLDPQMSSIFCPNSTLTLYQNRLPSSPPGLPWILVLSPNFGEEVGSHCGAEGEVELGKDEKALCAPNLEPRKATAPLLRYFIRFSFLFSWSIVDLQCCVSFRCMAKRFSYHSKRWKTQDSSFRNCWKQGRTCCFGLLFVMKKSWLGSGPGMRKASVLIWKTWEKVLIKPVHFSLPSSHFYLSSLQVLAGPQKSQGKSVQKVHNIPVQVRAWSLSMSLWNCILLRFSPFSMD